MTVKILMQGTIRYLYKKTVQHEEKSDCDECLKFKPVILKKK